MLGFLCEARMGRRDEDSGGLCGDGANAWAFGQIAWFSETRLPLRYWALARRGLVSLRLTGS